MAKHLNVNLAFTADMKQARTELQNLQSQLTQLANTPVSLKGALTQEIVSASNAAAELKVHLEQAMNAQTGNLDFSKLNQSIQKSGISLQEYGDQLKSLGPAGMNAFQSLAQSVAKAEIPLRRSNTLITEFWTTLKNTARWQISSSILHGFMGALQSAFGYAEDLNESLNNIRIVTNQNVEQMARFAEEANKAAKALSTTTTEYTNASLIYYQQGLSDEEVAKRTAVTIKMANAAGQSAEIVSDQLTAVWNNFAKGSSQLEYYADVMTALGAATASSTDEIAEGLNKFAAVAETVGLSYEYAAAALATVTSTTRQSADVVGTAFKTLFARIQDLDLGKTLDDGTTLGSYSAALAKVGINIKDANNELKDMDTILQEMGAKWDQLNKDQQVALAKSVAGIRQYTQLIALMDNWDFMERNLDTAYRSTGTLEKQAEIYAESWEAAQKRVTAAVESIYSDLLNDEFIIDVLNGFEKFLTLIDQVADSMGGVQGILAGISALVFKLFSSQISQGLTNMAYTLSMATASGRQSVQNQQAAFIQSAAHTLNPSDEFATMESQAREASLKNQLELQAQMITNADKMSAIELEVNQALMDRVRMAGDEVALKAQALDLAKETVATASQDARADAMYAEQFKSGYENRDSARKTGSEAYTKTSQLVKEQVGAETELLNILKQIEATGSASAEQMQALQSAAARMDKVTNNAFSDLIQDELDAIESGEGVEIGLREIAEAARIVIDETGRGALIDIGVQEGNADRVIDGYRQQAQAMSEHNASLEQEAVLVDDLSNRIINARGSQQTWADTVVSSAQSISSLSMALTSLGSAISVASNPDMSAWEKFASIAMSLSMGIPMLISGLTGLNTVLGVTSAIQNSAAFSAQLYLQTHKDELATLTAETLAKATKLPLDKAEVALSNAKAVAALKELVASKAKITSMTAEQLAEKTGMSIDKAKIVLSKLKAGATLAEATEEAGLTGVKMGGIAASVASSYAKGVETGARWANVVAIIAEQTAMAPLLVITLLIVAAMAALAAIIWVVVSAAQSISNAYNKDSIAAENAAAAAEQLAEAYQEVKAEYEDMVAAMENYQTARDSLDKLAEGTIEFREALQEANNEALKLIEAGNLIKGQDYQIENGQVIINDAALENARDAAFGETEEAYRASVMADAQAKASKAVADTTDIVRADNGNKLLNATLNGFNVGSATGMIASAITGPLSPAIALIAGAAGALGGLAGQAIDNANADKAERERINELVVLYDQLGEAAFDAATLQELGFNTANEKYIDSIKEIVRETDAAANAISTAAQLAASSVLSGDDRYEQSQHKEKVAGAAGRTYEEAYKKAYDEALKQTKNNDWFGVGSKQNKDAMARYAEAMGLDELNGYKITNFKRGGNVEYKYLDEEGKWQTKELTQAEIAAKLAELDAAEALTDQTSVLIDTFNRLEGSTDKADHALADFASGAIGDASKGEFEDLKNELASYMTGDELSLEGATKYINENFSTEELQAMGFESAEAAAEEFKTQFETNLRAWRGIDLPSNLIGVQDLNLTTAKALSNVLEDINIGPAGEKAGKTFVNGINKMISSLKPSEQQEAIKALTEIDWSSWDALEQADALMKQFGVDIDTSSQEWIDFATEMRKATGAIPDYSKLREDLASLNAIINDLDFGSIINDEDYDRLVSYNDEWERFFMLQADGSRMFIGDSTTMRKALQETQKAMIEDMAVKQGFLDVNWGYKDAYGEWQTTDWSTVTGSHIGAARNLMNAGGATEKYLKSQGYDDRIIEKFIRDYEGEDPSKQTAAKEALQRMFDTIAKMQDSNITQELEDMRSMYASTAVSYQELNTMLRKGDLGTKTKSKNDVYKKQLESIARTSFNDAETLAELDEAWNKAKRAGAVNSSLTSITNVDYSENLIRLAENSDIAAEALTRYQEVLESGDGGSVEREAQNALKYALVLDETAQKYDLNAEELQNFTVELSKSMNLTSQEALNMATGYMKMAEEFGISAEELIKHITALNALSFDPSTMTDALRELNTTAQECGISFEELVSICTDLSEEFNLTGDSGHDAIAMATTFAKANKDLGVSTAELKIQTKELQEQYGLTAKAASDLTVRNQRMNKGIQALYDNWENWSQELKKSDKTTVNYAKAAAGAQEAIRDLLGLSDDFDFADNFLEADATLTALEQAANGSEEAITKLGLAVSKSWVQSLEQVNTELDLLDEEGNIESKWTMMAEQFDIAKTTIIDGIIQMQENLSSLNVGDPVQSMGEEWIAAMNNMAIATGMSVDEMQSMLSSMGVSAKVETKYVEQKVQVPEYTTTEEVTAHKIDENVTAYTKTSSTTQTGVKEMNGMVPVAAIASDGNPETPEVIYTGAGKASPNTKKGGGPAATPKAPKFKEQRHVEKDDQIDDIDEEIKDLERALDNASGEDKVSLMRQIQDAKDRKAKLIDEKLKDDINKDEYLDRDKAALTTATKNLSQYGVADLEIDKNNNITNYEAIWNQIRTKEKELLDAWNNDTSEVNEKALNEFYDFVSQFEEAYDRFVDTREEIEDFANEIEDLKSKIHEPPDLDEVEDLKLDEYEHAFDDITTSIEAMERATERASKEADNLYGAKRAQALSRVNSSIQQEIGLLNKKIEIAKKVAKFQQDQLKMSLLTAQASLGAQLQFEFAADGSITNLSAVMEELIKKYNELVETYKNSIKAFQETGEGIEDWEKEQLDQMEAAIQQQSDFISKVGDQASRYNETLATISESMDSIADKQDEIKSNNYEILSTKLSYALDMTNAELQRIDYQLNKVADDIYKMGEAAGILSQKVGVGQDALAAYTTHMNDLNSAYQQGYIHESDYVAGLQEVRDGMYSELGALQELDKEMMNYYGETLSAASEEIGKYTDRMDSLNSVLDHYQSLMTLIGKETDYKAIGIVLQGAADTAQNSLAVAQATAEFYAKQAAEKKLLMENAIEGSKAFELYKKEWEAAEAASREAKENMLAKTQEWAEREKAVIENNFKDFKKSLEEALTGGSTFDYLSTQMERSVSLQEEYLTATNQIYETTKMINTAQKAIDQTTNTAAKRELQSFIQKTEQLKNQNKLSKYELDLHQAQYQILQAQIALEEAQNAKSTVRLRRDSEGNFGYVYTADTSKIADAEQKLADDQNAYYNKSLEGANKYVQNYTETLRNMQDDITALTDAWMQGEIQSEEEYNRRKEEIVQFYGEKLKQYSHLYQVAISADSRAVADAWSTDYADMIADTKDWQEKVDGYAGACIESMHKWQGVVATVQLTTGASYDEIAEKVHSVVTESEALVTAITDPVNGVIQAMQKQLEAVSGVTAKYAAQGRELDALISKVEEYIISIDAMIAKVGQANNITLTDPSTATIDGGGGSSGSGNTTTNNNNNGNNNSNSQNTSNSTESDSNVASYQTGKLSWYDDLQKGRIWTDSAGNTYSEDSVIGQKIQAAFDRAWRAAGQEYKGAWYLGWKNLNADELHEKYGLSTGGYTGDWAGPMGKLAFLHQKEIVLNKDDTANLLAAVDMLRTILHTLDVHSMSAQLGGILSTPGFHMGDSGTLEQNVKIEASFPNVQDHNEIEEAFNNLINKASQYANRK